MEPRSAQEAPGMPGTQTPAGYPPPRQPNLFTIILYDRPETRNRIEAFRFEYPAHLPRPQRCHCRPLLELYATVDLRVCMPCACGVVEIACPATLPFLRVLLMIIRVHDRLVPHTVAKLWFIISSIERGTDTSPVLADVWQVQEPILAHQPPVTPPRRVLPMWRETPSPEMLRRLPQLWPGFPQHVGLSIPQAYPPHMVPGQPVYYPPPQAPSLYPPQNPYQYPFHPQLQYPLLQHPHLLQHPLSRNVGPHAQLQPRYQLQPHPSPPQQGPAQAGPPGPSDGGVYLPPA